MDIQSGGYKLSALEIEREILSHPDVTETAVVGVDDSVYGQKVVAIVTRRSSVHDDNQTTVQSIMKFLEGRLAAYKRPRKVVVIPAIPRNLMGKVNKKTLLKDVGLIDKL